MEQLINFIIRPPRAEYDPQNDLLDQEFMLKGKCFQRKDVEITNSRGDVLKCSHYVPIVRPKGKALPCVIYCHGNSGCRTDASEAAIILLPSNITVFTLDFSGSGLSGGEYVTLGWNEKDDLRAVVDYLRTDENVSLIGLWGRSMGAVTSLMYGAEDPSIAGMVLDSPFSNLVDLMMELVDTYKVRLPNFAVKFAIQYMRRAIQKKAKFDITELNTIKVAKSSFVPVLLGHATDDDFIQPHHSDQVYAAYEGDKNIIKFEGDHNSPRPQFYFDSINIFFHNVLQPPEDEVGGTFFTSHDYLDKGLRYFGYDGDFLAASTASSSTADAIEQLRSRMPMTRTEVPADISVADKQSDGQVEANEAEQVHPSPKMINFEFSDGHPYGPHVHALVEDDNYIEYPLDDLACFPSNAEEEERMLMEALIESLKDLETRQNPIEGQQSCVNANPPPEPPQKDEEEKHPDETPAQKPLVMATSDSSSDLSLLSTAHNRSRSSDGISSSTPPRVEELQSTSSDVGNSSGTNAGDQTKATITVVKNPAGNTVDGLFRRWDLNFFRSSR